MLATSKRLRSSSPPSSPLDQVTKRRRYTSSQQGSSSQQGPAALHEDDELDGESGWQQTQWVAAGPSGWRGDVPPAHSSRPVGGSSSWDLVGADSTFYSPTGRPPAPSAYFHPHRSSQQATAPSPLGPAGQSPSYFPPFPPASAALLQQATNGSGGGPSIHTPRATTGAQHDSHAHHRNAPLFHPAFVDQHPPWSSSSSAASSSAVGGGAHGRPPDGMGPVGGSLHSQREAITPLMGPPTVPVPLDGRNDSRRASFGWPIRAGPMDDEDEDDDDDDDADTWETTAGTVQGNVDSLADSPYAGMNQLLHSLHRPRQPRPDVASSPFPHFVRSPLQHARQAYQHAHPSPQTPLEHGPGRLESSLALESSATRHRYGEVNRQLGELVLNRRVGRGLGDVLRDGEGR